MPPDDPNMAWFVSVYMRTELGIFEDSIVDSISSHIVTHHLSSADNNIIGNIMWTIITNNVHISMLFKLQSQFSYNVVIHIGCYELIPLPKQTPPMAPHALSITAALFI